MYRILRDNIIEAVACEICDHYCKWPDYYNKLADDSSLLSKEECMQLMHDSYCTKCPLDMLS